MEYCGLLREASERRWDIAQDLSAWWPGDFLVQNEHRGSLLRRTSLHRAGREARSSSMPSAAKHSGELKVWTAITSLNMLAFCVDFCQQARIAIIKLNQ